jgi:hypothetical protein
MPADNERRGLSSSHRLVGLCRASLRVDFQLPLRNVRLGALVEARWDAGRNPGVPCLGCFAKTRRHLSPPQNRCEAPGSSAPQVSHLAIAYPPKPIAWVSRSSRTFLRRSNSNLAKYSSSWCVGFTCIAHPHLHPEESLREVGIQHLLHAVERDVLVTAPIWETAPGGS